MIQKELLLQIIDQYLAGTNYYLVDVNISQDNEISIEIDSFAGVSIDFCAKMNRHIESLLDRNVEDYQLEVCSAGLTEPFKVLKQYEKNIGNEVEILTKDGKKLRGTLSQANTENFTVSISKMVKPENAKRKITIQEEQTFNYSEIKYTKYIIIFK